MINVIREPTQTIAQNATTQNVDLARGIFLEKLVITIEGTVLIAGGTTNGTVIADGVARLIDSFIVRWNNDPIVNISGRDLLAETRMGSKTTIPGVELSAAAAASYPISLTLVHYFARPWLVNPFETVLPPLRIGNQFKAFVTFNQSVNAGAGSGAGTGVLVNGGDRTVTFSTPLTVNILQYGSLRGKLPWYLPYTTGVDSDQFAAANARFRYQIPSGRDARRFDSVYVSPRNGTLQTDADILNTLTVGQQGAAYYNAVRRADLRADQRQKFPALSTSTDFALLFADGGWLGNVAEPGSMVAPIFQFDLAAPTGTGVVHLLFNELVTHPEYTLVQERGNAA